MGKTKNCYIISESTGYSLNINHDDAHYLKLSNTTRDLWTKHNWLIEKVVRDESNYDDNFVEGMKSQSGLLRPVCDSGMRNLIALVVSKKLSPNRKHCVF